MGKIQDVFGAAPKTVLNKPLMHVQDQKAYNVGGGTSVANAWTTRDLNTVITNEIPGASLAANAITLPAGTYYVEGDAQHRLGSAVLSLFVNSNRLLQSTSSYSVTGHAAVNPTVGGLITLSQSSNIELKYYAGTSESTYGLGVANSIGSITDSSIPSIYADLKIWQLDADVKTPVASSAQAFNGQGYLTGGITGLELSKSAANTIDVSAGSCMDSTNTIPLALSAAETGVAVPTTINTMFHVFIVKYDGGTFGVEVDTDVDGVNLPGTVDKFRWIGFVRNNSSGVLMDFRHADDCFAYMKPSETVVASGFSATSFTLVDISGMVPVGRISEIFIGAATATAAEYSIYLSLDVVNTATWFRSDTNLTDTTNVWANGLNAFSLRQIPIVNGTIYAKISSGSVDIGIAQVKLRR